MQRHCVPLSLTGCRPRLERAAVTLVSRREHRHWRLRRHERAMKYRYTHGPFVEIRCRLSAPTACTHLGSRILVVVPAKALGHAHKCVWLQRHSRRSGRSAAKSRNPGSWLDRWIPAFAGTTIKVREMKCVHAVAVGTPATDKRPLSVRRRKLAGSPPIGEL
jgi:hypothetical protein